MIVNFSKGKKHLLLVLCFLVFGACKQSEFYEKENLSEMSKGSDSGANGEGQIAGEGGAQEVSGFNDGLVPVGSTVIGGTASNPIVITPVVVNPAVTNPVVTNPVVTNPVVTNPVVTNPVVTNPVVTNPVVTNPVVTNPVVTNPVVTNPVVTIPVVTVPVVVTPPAVVITPVPPIIKPAVALNDRSESFIQNVSKKGDVDILWVIDDSGSMADKQDSLGRNFSVFINQFLDKEIDFKMAITTTDATSKRNGMMVGDSSLLTSAAAKKNKSAFISNFTNLVKVGIKGSASEQGLKTSTSFMDRYASSFLRPEAFLVVVYLADEDDQSSLKVSEYLAKLQKLKANKGMVKAYSIVTVAKKESWESVGKRYMEISAATAGTTSDIRKNFADSLLDMGGTIVNLIDSFALNEAPYENQIEVFVGGAKVDSGYTFNAASRSIKFDAKSLPAEGSKIEIRYKVKK